MSNATTLQNLNTALQMELTAAHQYQLHAHVLDDWGLDLLAAKMRGEVAEETVHQDRFLQRIMELGGEPELAFARTPRVARSLKDLFGADLEDEEEAIRFYTEASKAAWEAGDLKSRALFEAVAIEEVGHRDWLGQQLDLLKRIGEQNYAAKYVSGAEPGA